MSDENLQTALEFGVVTPETAEKLDWKKPTIFYWVGVKQMNLCYKKDSNFWSVEDHRLIPSEAYNINIFPAPQMHEIELPEGWVVWKEDGLWYFDNLFSDLTHVRHIGYPTEVEAKLAAWLHCKKEVENGEN